METKKKGEIFVKKLLIPTILIFTLLTASCGKKADNSATPSPSASPAATATASTSSPSAVAGQTTNAPDVTGTPEQTDNSGYTIDGDANTNNETDQSSNRQTDSVSIINGSSTAFYAVYLTTTANGNPGENIIGDTPLSEGEEIVLPFANAPSELLTVIVEDENGIQYSAGGISLANGLTIELHLEGGVLEAIVQ